MKDIIVSILLVAFIVFMLIWKIRFEKKGTFLKNYFSVDETGSIKGMCAVFILLSHLCVTFAEDFSAFLLFKNVGAIMVGGFFFVSGYGLEYSMMNKENYLKDFFSKRFLPLAVTYYTVNLFYIYASDMTTNDILKSLLGYNGNLWFVMTIGIFYIGFYICNKMFKDRNSIIAMTVYIAMYIAVMRLLGFGDWWYNSCIAFVLGMWVCYYKESFTAFFQRKYILKLIVLIAVFALTYVLYCRHMNDQTLTSLAIGLVNTSVFPVMLAVVAMKVQIGNPVLNVCGRLSFEIYLTHALLIHWLKNGFWYNVTGKIFNNQLIYLVGVIVGTFVFSLILHVLCQDMAWLIKEKYVKVLKKTDKCDKIN